MISFHQPPITHHARFPYHGNYGGPEYTGAKLDGSDFSLKPVDLLDRSYREHDAFYHHGLERTGDIKHVNDVTRDWDKYSLKEKLKGGLSAVGFAAKSFISKDKLKNPVTTGDADLHRILPKHGPSNKEMHAYNGNMHGVGVETNQTRIQGRYNKIKPGTSDKPLRYKNDSAFAPYSPAAQRQEAFKFPYPANLKDTVQAAKKDYEQRRSRPSPSNQSMHASNGNIKGKKLKTIAKRAGMRLGAPSAKKAKQKTKKHPVKNHEHSNNASGHTVASGVFNNPLNKNKEGKQLSSCTEPCHDRLGAVALSAAQHFDGQVVFTFPCNLVNFGNRTQNLASMYSMWKSKLRIDIEINAPTSLGGEYTAFFDPDPEHSYISGTSSVENTQRAYQMTGRKIFNPAKASKVTVSHPGHPKNTAGLGPDGWLYTHAEDSDERITEYGTFVVVCTGTTTTHTGGVFSFANNSNISFKNADFNTTTLSDSLCASYYGGAVGALLNVDMLQMAMLPLSVASSNYTGTEVTPYIVNRNDTSLAPSTTYAVGNAIGLRPGLWAVDVDVQSTASLLGITFAFQAISNNVTIVNSTVAHDPVRVGNAFGITKSNFGVRASATLSIYEHSAVATTLVNGWIPKVMDGNNSRPIGTVVEYRQTPVQVGSFEFYPASTIGSLIDLISLSVRRLPPVLVPNPKFGSQLQSRQDRLDKIEIALNKMQLMLDHSRMSTPIHVEDPEAEEQHWGNEAKCVQQDFVEFTKQYAPTGITIKNKDGSSESIPLSQSFINQLGALTGLAKPLAK